MYYSFSETIKNIISFFYTKLFHNKARLIRLPFYLRGKKYVSIGKGFTCGYRCRIEVDGRHNEKCIVIGDNVSIGDNVRLSASEKITLGDGVLVASNVLFVDNAHGVYKFDNQSNPEIKPIDRKISSSPILISENVWIGQNCVIQQGVTIGKGAIIAANSVVTKSIPENCIAGGAPAKILKKYDSISQTWIKVQ